MKLIAFFVFAVYCSSLANSSITRARPSQEERKLEEVLRWLNGVRKTLEHGQMLPTPPKDIEDCCCQPALKCFQLNLKVQSNSSDVDRLSKSLTHRVTLKGLDFCKSGNSTCQNCASHPMESATEFFNRLESLIQKGITRLKMM